MLNTNASLYTHNYGYEPMEQSLCECGSLPNSDSISVIPTWCQSMQAGSVTALAEVVTLI